MQWPRTIREWQTGRSRQQENSGYAGRYKKDFIWNQKGMGCQKEGMCGLVRSGEDRLLSKDMSIQTPI